MQAFVLSRDLFFVTLFVYTTVLLCSRDKVLYQLNLLRPSKREKRTWPVSRYPDLTLGKSRDVFNKPHDHDLECAFGWSCDFL